MKNPCCCLRENSEVFEKLWLIDWDWWWWFLILVTLNLSVGSTLRCSLSLCPSRHSWGHSSMNGWCWRSFGVSGGELVDLFKNLQRKGHVWFFKSRPFLFFLCRPHSILNSRYRWSQMMMQKFLRSNFFSIWVMQVKKKTWNHSQLTPLAKLIATVNTTIWGNHFKNAMDHYGREEEKEEEEEIWASLNLQLEHITDVKSCEVSRLAMTASVHFEAWISRLAIFEMTVIPVNLVANSSYVRIFLYTHMGHLFVGFVQFSEIYLSSVRRRLWPNIWR